MNTKLTHSELESVLESLLPLFAPWSMWAITGSANLVIRGLKDSANDIDIICSIDVLHQVVESQLGLSVPRQKTQCEAIYSYFVSFPLMGATIELMSEVENFVNGEWIKNSFWDQCIEVYKISPKISVNCMSIRYEKYINAHISNTEVVHSLSHLACT